MYETQNITEQNVFDSSDDLVNSKKTRHKAAIEWSVQLCLRRRRFSEFFSFRGCSLCLKFQKIALLSIATKVGSTLRKRGNIVGIDCCNDKKRRITILALPYFLSCIRIVWRLLEHWSFNFLKYFLRNWILYFSGVRNFRELRRQQ